MIPSLPWAVAALAATAVALSVVGGSLVWSSWRVRRDRDHVVSRLQVGKKEITASQVSELFREEVEQEPFLTELIDRLPRSADLGRLLEQAEMGWSRARFLAYTLVTAVVGWVLGWLVSGIPVVGLVPAMLAATGPYLYVLWRKRKRIEAFEQLFPEAIDLLGRAIRAGHAFSTGLQMVADEMTDPMAYEFRRVFEEQKYGLPLEDSLYELAARVDLVDVRIFSTAVLIQREVGGNLAEILDNLAGTIRERFMIHRQVRIHTAQGRLTGYLLSGLPFAAAFIIFLLNPEYMTVLWTETLGRLLITVAMVMQFIGFLVIRKIVNIEV